MALEPITRQEKIIAGQDLTPITRMEKFLKNFGGSGGGGGVQMVTITVVSDSNENFTYTSSHTGAEIAEMLTKSPVQFVLDFSGALLPLAFIGCYMEMGECCVVLQSFTPVENGAKITENLLVIPASSTACKAGMGDTYTIV